MDSRSGGGKIVRNRRRRVGVGPYERPSEQDEEEGEAVPKSPNWLTGHIFPATRTIFSGAAKILTSVFNSDSSSSSSSSSDTDSIFENDAREENDIRSEVDELNKDAQLSGERSKTKHLIEQLLIQETFSRKERDKFVRIINSRVLDSSSLEGEGSFALRSAIPRQTVANDTLDLSSQAIIEARKWLEEKRDALGSDITHGGLSSVVKNVDDTFGSPVDMAKSYMKVRPPWASPTVNHSGHTTPSQMKAKLFEEGTPYTVSGDSLKKKNSFASGSWNIQDEIRKVRSKATEDLLRALPSKGTDYQSHSIEYKIEAKSAVGNLSGISTTEKIYDSSSLRLTKLSDVPIEWSDVEITQDGENEAGPINPASVIQLQDQGVETIQDGEHAANESHMPSGPVFPLENSDGLHVTDSEAQQVTRPNLSQSSNGYTSLEASLSAGHNNAHFGGEELKPGMSSQDKLIESIPAEDKCELLSESVVNVPAMYETIGSPTASMPSEELSQEEPTGLIHNLAKNGKVMKQPGKRPGRYAARKTRARGK